MRFALICIPALLVLGGCNRYEMFRVAGYEQDSFSNKADILFVIDNSPSMAPISNAIADNFSSFIDTLAAVEDTTEREDLSDAVTNYVDYVQNPGAYVDYQLGITTTHVTQDGDPGDDGMLLGDNPIIRRDDNNVAGRFTNILLNKATCDNDTNCGSAQEEPLEATFLAMCRSVPNPPEDCFEEVQVGTNLPTDAVLSQNDILSNGEFLRSRSTFLPVLVTDEGDNSRRLAQGVSIADEYLDLTSMFGRHVSWVVIGPPTNEDFEPLCPSPSPDWGTVRFQYLIQLTNGLKINILDPSDCEPADFDTALQKLGDLLQSLLTSFPLQSVPKTESILVFVDGKSVPEATVISVDNFGIDKFGAGWTYDPDTNSIQFHSTAIPPNDANVEVYYEPLDGMPRSLPF